MGVKRKGCQQSSDRSSFVRNIPVSRGSGVERGSLGSVEQRVLSRVGAGRGLSIYLEQRGHLEAQGALLQTLTEPLFSAPPERCPQGSAPTKAEETSSRQSRVRVYEFRATQARVYPPPLPGTGHHLPSRRPHKVGEDMSLVATLSCSQPKSGHGASQLLVTAPSLTLSG